MFHNLRALLCFFGGLAIGLVSIVAMFGHGADFSSLIMLGMSAVAIWWGKKLKTEGQEIDRRLAEEKRFFSEIKNHWESGAFAAVANILVFFVFNVRAGYSFAEPPPETLISWGASYPPLTSHGDPWRLISSIFLHGDFNHLFGNVIAMYFVGRYIQYYFGIQQWIAIYLFTGVVASLSQAILSPLSVALGASGAVFGLEGALVGLFIVYWNSEQRLRLTKPTIVSIVVHLLQSLYGGFGHANVANAAHFGGFLSGMAAVLFFEYMRHGQELRVKTLLGTSVAAYLFCQILIFPSIPSRQMGLSHLQARKVLKEIIQCWDTVVKLGDEMILAGHKMKSGDMTAKEVEGLLRSSILPQVETIGRQVYNVRSPSNELYQAQISLYKLIYQTKISIQAMLPEYSNAQMSVQGNLSSLSLDSGRAIASAVEKYR